METTAPATTLRRVDGTRKSVLFHRISEIQMLRTAEDARPGLSENGIAHIPRRDHVIVTMCDRLADLRLRVDLGEAVASDLHVAAADAVLERLNDRSLRCSWAMRKVRLN
jgi:hypothetical protein